MLSNPSANFTVPSLYDNLELDCRLYFPKLKARDEDTVCKGFAIFAHPYAAFGGSYDDPVVHSVGSLLVSEGFLLVTFNFRGAEGSAGRTSWTGKAELGDYVSVYAFILAFLNVAGVLKYLEHDSSSKPTLLLGGYSYGSMITSYLPAIQLVQEIIVRAMEGTAEFEIKERADKLAQAFLGFCETHQHRGRALPDRTAANATFGGYTSPTASTKIRRESSRHSVDVERVRRSVDRVRYRLSRGGSDELEAQQQAKAVPSTAFILPQTMYLIISPLFGAVSSFATMFSSLRFERRERESTAARDNALTDPATTLSQNSTLVIFGTHDHFQSSKRTRTWCEHKGHQGSRLEFVEVGDAGHFWHEQRIELQLLAAVKHWLEQQ